MRQVGNLATENDARRFASYLITQGISAQAEPDGQEWTIWVRDENRIQQARELFDVFKSDPSSNEYRAAERTAESIRREQRHQRVESQKNFVEMRGRWHRSASQRAPLTLTLIALSILVTLTSSFGQATEGIGAAVRRQMAFVDPVTYQNSNGNPLASVAKGEAWRLVTPIFVHLSTIHLIFNMIMFFQFAVMVEAKLGTARLAGLILFIALLSNLGQAIMPSNIGGNPFFGGMSGVVYGLFGYVWLKSMTDPKSGFFMNQTTVIILVGWLFLCMTPAMPNVANVAHVVGLVAGMALGYVPSLWKS